MKKILYTDFVDTESIIEKMLGQKEIRKAITRNNYTGFGAKSAVQNLHRNLVLIQC